MINETGNQGIPQGCLLRPVLIAQYLLLSTNLFYKEFLIEGVMPKLRQSITGWIEFCVNSH